MNENKYALYIQLAMDNKVDSKILSSVIEDALLLYCAKTGEKLNVAQMALYEDFIVNNIFPAYKS